MSKSDQIRAILKVNPQINASDVLNILAKKKVYVTSALVYQVRSKMPAYGRSSDSVSTALVPMPAVQAEVVTPQTITDVLKDIKSVAAKCGGVEELRQILEYIKV